MYMKKHLLALIPAILAVCVASAKNDAVKLDFDTVTGPVKPVNSVGQAPIQGLLGFDFFHYLKEANVKYSRTHDVAGEFSSGVFVDIPNIFRNFDADENDPASYDFTFTDKYLQALVDAGMEPYYRLGVSIENYCTTKAYRIYPPKDYQKWARICEHIILHYNYGWADGFHFGITHWEIWNEADGYEDPIENQMWRGTFDQYLDLYGVAAPYLKSKFPELMIGGPACTGFRILTGDYPPEQKHRRQYTDDCFIKFVKSARDNKWPLDFFSFHSYSAVYRLPVQIEHVRKTLDEYGFKDTQISLNEWLPSPARYKLGSSKQAAQIAAAILLFQNGPVDDAEIYDARMTGSNYSPLFNPLTQTPHKAYYSIKMFGELRTLGKAVDVPGLPELVYGCAATDGNGKAAIMISNISDKDWKNNLQWPGYKVDSISVIDEERTFETLKSKRLGKLGSFNVAIIRLSRQ